MSSTYTPDDTNDPASITIPSDGDGPGIKAADVNAAFEGLADKIAYTQAKTLFGNFGQLEVAYDTLATSFTTSSGTSATAHSVSIDAEVGDLIIFFASAVYIPATTSDFVEAQINVAYPGPGSVDYAQTKQHSSATATPTTSGAYPGYRAFGYRVAAVAGTHVVSVKVRTGANGGGAASGNATYVGGSATGSTPGATLVAIRVRPSP